jgi:hypothetical protein
LTGAAMLLPCITSYSIANIIKDEIYSLTVTVNKRKLIYENDRFIDTAPLKLVNGENIK